MDIFVLLILTVIVAMSICIGCFMFFKPGLSIEIQKRFYEKINWRIEPISMAKEIRNTRIMGLCLFFVSALVAGYIVLTKGRIGYF
jgi:hypothetical protein